jgi:hypothetical protein
MPPWLSAGDLAGAYRRRSGAGADRSSGGTLAFSDSAGRLRDPHGVVARDDGDSVVIGDDDVARMRDDPANRNRFADARGSVFERTGGRKPARPHGKPDFAEDVDVADRTVDHRTNDALGKAAFGEQFAEECPGFVSFAVDDHEVTRLGML